jgi:tRNA-(ms[2]io[6]A)-hydroxylase
MAIDISHILEFLPCATPKAWVAEAVKAENLTLLLADHRNLELKAAQTAQSLMWRYGMGNTQPGAGEFAHRLLNKLSRLAREELRHFEQVIAIMHKRAIDCPQLSASRYPAGLRAEVRAQEPARLVDTLLVGALIEARSCERFACLAPELDDELAEFYGSLLKSESRHFLDYLKLAESIADGAEVEQRLLELKVVERTLIESTDTEFRFHSGPPAAS